MVSSDQATGCLDDFSRSMLIVPEDVAKDLRIKALGEPH